MHLETGPSGSRSFNEIEFLDITAGHAIADQDLARVSPLLHGHVIPNGTYRFGDEEESRPVYAAAS